MRSPLPAVLLSASLLAWGCSLATLEGDRLFQENRFGEAADAYRNYLDRNSPTTPKGSRALFRLGLIYALPDSPLYDVDRAEETLGQLVRTSGTGTYGRQAAFILDLQRSVVRLQQVADSQAALRASLESELGRLEERAAEASSVAGEEASRALRLNDEISQLRSEITRLTEALEQRKTELERIKKIDLERLP